MRIAIVHDFLNQFGGAERVVAALHEIWPEAPIYTSIYDQSHLPPIFGQMDIRVSFMQQFPLVFPLFKFYFPVYPLAFEKFDLSEYDVIFSSSSAFAKGVRKRPGQLHLCYCHNPMRFVWQYSDYVKEERWPSLLKKFLPYLLEPIKQWDLKTNEQVDFFVANSKVVKDRLARFYGRDAKIIYPPVETSLFKISNYDSDYFLIVSRLNAYKRLDIAIEAFNQLGLPLRIIGEGPAKRQLQALAGPNIRFLGRQSDHELALNLARSRALILPGEEDFGIVALEAMAAGRPVIAYRGGGATETVSEGLTGMFFDEQTPAALAAAVNEFQFKTFNKLQIRRYAQRGFDKEVFKQRLLSFVEEKWARW